MKKAEKENKEGLEKQARKTESEKDEKHYIKPKLTRYGKLSELTQGSGFSKKEPSGNKTKTGGQS